MDKHDVDYVATAIEDMPHKMITKLGSPPSDPVCIDDGDTDGKITGKDLNTCSRNDTSAAQRGIVGSGVNITGKDLKSLPDKMGSSPSDVNTLSDKVLMKESTFAGGPHRPLQITGGPHRPLQVSQALPGTSPLFEGVSEMAAPFDSRRASEASTEVPCGLPHASSLCSPTALEALTPSSSDASPSQPNSIDSTTFDATPSSGSAYSTRPHPSTMNECKMVLYKLLVSDWNSNGPGGDKPDDSVIWKYIEDACASTSS